MNALASPGLRAPTPRTRSSSVCVYRQEEWFKKEKQLSTQYLQAQSEVLLLKQRASDSKRQIEGIDGQLRELIDKIDLLEEEVQVKRNILQQLEAEQVGVLKRHAAAERRHTEALHRIVSERNTRADLHVRKMECEQQLEILNIELRALQSIGSQASTVTESVAMFAAVCVAHSCGSLAGCCVFLVLS